MQVIREKSFWYGLCAIMLLQLFLQMILGNSLFEHSVYDSYSWQAMVWRSGHIVLPEDRPWLELAIYQGRFWLSFPPFPAVPMLVLSFVFGENTPSALVSMVCFATAYIFAYRLCRRYMENTLHAAFAAVFVCAGCNMLELCLYGGVWNLAQAMGFMLTMASAYLVSGASRRQCLYGLICIALAVGCRPFQAFYVPIALYLVWRVCGGFRKLIPLLAVPALIAVAYAAYNYIRFGNPLEFGHNYLPEFAQQSVHGQFSLEYVAGNLRNIFRLPDWDFEQHRMVFPAASGFLFFLCNPIFLISALSCIKRKWDMGDTILTICLVLHFFALLLHKSFGGWQFGTRYLCDLVPYLALFWMRRYKQGFRLWEPPLMMFAVAFNFYGAIAHHLLSNI